MGAIRNVDPQVAHHRSRKATAIRDGRHQDAETADRDLRAAMLEKSIRQLAEQAPPLTDTQRIRLVGLLCPTGGDR